MSRRPRRVFRSSLCERTSGPSVDMNRPGSPDYAERHRQFSLEIAPGMKRVDIGARIDAPGRATAIEERAGEQPAASPAKPVATPAPKPAGPITERDWKADYGLSKGE